MSKKRYWLPAIAALMIWGVAVRADSKHKDTSSLAVQQGRLGLAARYPGDRNIGQDPAVVFHEDFEDGSVSALESEGRWTQMSNKDGWVMHFQEDAPPNSSGSRCLEMKGTNGHDTGGHLWKLLEEGHDTLYARFYCKFAPDAPYVHHFVHMGGKMSTLPYPEGGAGSRPSGSSRFSTSMDLAYRDQVDPPGAWTFYSYWCEMHSWQTPEGESDGRPNPYYGNLFGPVEPLPAKRDVWQCVEIMIKLNDPEERNGEQAFWIDGELVEVYGPGTIEGTWFRDKFRRSGVFNTDPQPFEGFRWRTTEHLKINTFWLQYYLAHVFENDYSPADTTIPYNDQEARVYFDDIVLATEYIGPIATDRKPSMDYDGDGQAGVMDVVRLMRLCLLDPPDGGGDYNGDGACNLKDVLTLLIDLVRKDST